MPNFFDIIPQKSFFRPNETAKFSVISPQAGRLEVSISYLNQDIETLNLELQKGENQLIWDCPDNAPKAYGLDAILYDGTGKAISKKSIGFDVLNHWIEAPRYGFLSEFTPERPDAEETMQWLNRYHINGLQFYDWQYRHEYLLPPEGSDIYSDVLGREMSYQAVIKLIEAAQCRGIAAMPYTAVYGASQAFYQTHPDWALFSEPDRAFRFGDGFLMIMNPSVDAPWGKHLLGQFAEVLEKTSFDGIHIDQYGAPIRGEDAEGNYVELESVFAEFIEKSKQIVIEKRGEEGVVLFNAVRNYPLYTLAPSQVDAVYIEVWEPYRNLLDLHRIVVEAQRLSDGKPVIIAAYINPQQQTNVLLANAILFASGGYSIELGEPETLLADPYFPKFGKLSPELAEKLRRYYDFAVRYENILSLRSVDSSQDAYKKLKLAQLALMSHRSQDCIALIARSSENIESYSLINLMGIGGEHWDSPLPHAPKAQSNVELRITLDKVPKAAYWISPDSEDLSAHNLDYSLEASECVFVLPSLDYWTVLVLEYEA